VDVLGGCCPAVCVGSTRENKNFVKFSPRNEHFAEFKSAKRIVPSETPIPSVILENTQYSNLKIASKIIFKKINKEK
jgi:hypothetical protein